MDASVSLNAIDNVTGPTSSALASIQKYEAAIDSMAMLGGQTAESSARMAAGISSVGAASAASEIPHRAAHQALALVTTSMGSLAGASKGAEGAIRVVDSVLFQIAMTGGAVSMGFIAATAAIVGLVTVITSMAEAGKKADDEYKKLLDSVNALGPASNDAAMGIIRQAQAQIKLYEAQLLIERQTPTMGAKVKSAFDSFGPASKAAIDQVGAFAKAILSPVAAAQAMAKGTHEAMAQTAVAMVKPNEAIDALKKKIEELGKATQAALGNLPNYDIVLVGLHKLGEAFDNLSMEYIGKANDAIAKDSEELMKWAEQAGYTYQKAIQLANAPQAMAMGWQKASQVITQTDKLIENSVASMVAGVTDSLAQMLINGQGTWSTMMNGLLKTVGDAMKQIGEMWLAADLMVAMGIGVGGIGAAIGLIAAGSVLSALATPKIGNVGGGGSSGGSSGGAAGSAASGGSSGIGGSAVSSAQQTVNNNISISLPVEALDLSSVSDGQMRSLANRIARLIAQGATGGQLSLAGG